MYFNIFPFIHFTAFVVYVFLAVYIIQKDYKALLNRFFFLLFSLFAVWSFGLIFVHNYNSTKETATFFMSLSSLGWIWISVLFLWFAFLQTRTKVNIWIIGVFTILPSLLFSYLQWSNKLIIDYKEVYYGWSLVFSKSWVFYAWALYYLLLGVVIFSILTNRIVKEKKGVYRTQLIIIFIFSIVTLIVGTLIDVFFPFLDIRVVPDAANLIALVWLLGIGFAIIRYKIFIITPLTASENILYTMSDILIMADFKGKVTNINKSAENLLDYKNNSVKGVSAEIFFQEPSIFKKILDSVYSNKEAISEKTYLRKRKGYYLPVILNSLAIKDESGNFIGIIFLGRDITNFQATEEKLRKKSKELEEKIKEQKKFEAKLFNLLENLNQKKENTDAERKKTNLIVSNLTDPIIFINNQNKIDLVNPAAKIILKLKKRIIGHLVSEENNYSLINFKKLIGADFDYQENKKLQSGFEEIKLRYLDQIKVFKVFTSEVKNDFNYKIGTLKIFYDFTRERILEKIKSEFISTASHKLRTPLSAIKWVIKMALDGDAGKLNSEQFELLDKAYRSNERIIELVNNLLNVSKIEEGRFGYNFKKVNFKEPIDVISDYAQALAEKNNIKFSINYEGEMPEVLMDQDRIILVLQNLIDNAMKYTPSSGKIEVNIKKEVKWLCISIKDNGVGIPREDQKKLFTKFFRAKNVIRMQTDGSGLGLFIVKKIIEKHNGKLSIKSQEGRGTEISFSLPIKASPSTISDKNLNS